MRPIWSLCVGKVNLQLEQDRSSNHFQTTGSFMKLQTTEVQSPFKCGESVTPEMKFLQFPNSDF